MSKLLLHGCRLLVPCTTADRWRGLCVSNGSQHIPRRLILFRRSRSHHLHAFSISALVHCRSPRRAQAAELWERASDADKAPYYVLSNQDKARQSMEQEAYHYSLASLAAAAKALQASQALGLAAAALAQAHPIGTHLFQALEAEGLLSVEGGDVPAEEEAGGLPGGGSGNEQQGDAAEPQGQQRLLPGAAWPAAGAAAAGVDEPAAAATEGEHADEEAEGGP